MLLGMLDTITLNTILLLVKAAKASLQLKEIGRRRVPAEKRTKREKQLRKTKTRRSRKARKKAKRERKARRGKTIRTRTAP